MNVHPPQLTLNFLPKADFRIFCFELETFLNKHVKTCSPFFQKNNFEQKCKVFCFHRKSQPIFNQALKLNSHHPHTFTSLLQQAIKQNCHALHDCDSVKNMLLNIQMVFKCVIAWNRMIRVHVKLVTCLN